MIPLLFFFIMGALMPTRGPKDYGDGEMLPLLKRHEIEVLLKAGFSAKDVAERSGASLRSVRRVQEEAAVEHTDDRAERAHRRIGRSPKAAPFVSKVVAWLAADSALPSQELLRRAKAAGYTGKKSAFYAIVAEHRPARATPVVRFEGPCPSPC